MCVCIYMCIYNYICAYISIYVCVRVGGGWGNCDSNYLPRQGKYETNLESLLERFRKMNEMLYESRKTTPTIIIEGATQVVHSKKASSNPSHAITFTFGLTSLRKIWTSLYPWFWVKRYNYCSSTRMALTNEDWYAIKLRYQTNKFVQLSQTLGLHLSHIYDQ